MYHATTINAPDCEYLCDDNCASATEIPECRLVTVDGTVIGVMHYRVFPVLYSFADGESHLMTDSPPKVQLTESFLSPSQDGGVFVVSSGRSRTKWITELLNLSQRITAFHEPAPAPPLDWPNHDDPLSSPLRRHRIAECDIYAESNCHLAPYVAGIIKRLPLAKALFTPRNPRDTILSFMALQDYMDDDLLRMYPPWVPVEGEDGFDEWSNMERVERVIWWWNKTAKIGLELESEYPDNVLRLKVEDMDAADNIVQMFDWLEVLPPKSDDIRDVQAQKIHVRDTEKKPVSWCDEWEALLPRDTMEALGYA